MFKKLAQKGFTLAEIMVALGILSAVVLVITSTQNQSIRATKDAKRNQEINELIQMLTSELSKLEVCKKNFQGTSFDTIQNIPKLYTAANTTPWTPLLAASTSYYGEMIKVDQITGLKAGQKLTITVKYTPRKTIEKVAPTQSSFSIVLNVFANSSGTIYSCFSDPEDAIKKAVQNACTGNGSIWLDSVASPPYGSCLHKIKLLNSAGATVAKVATGSSYSFTCPDGEMLKEVQASSSGFRVLKCGKFEVNGVCPSWAYLSGIDSSGNKVCTSILDFFTGTGFIAGLNTTFTAFSSVGCPANTIMTSLNVTGSAVTPNCVNPNLNTNCPVGQYAYSTNSNGTVNCTNYPDNNACGGGTYMTAVNSVGVVTCGYPTLTGSCGAGYAVGGTTTGGAVTCTLVPY